MTFELLLLTALAADLLIGDPRWMPHPVRGIGWVAVTAEKFLRRLISHQKIAGILTFAATFLLSVGSVVCLLKLALLASPVMQTIVAVIIIYFFIAVKDLIVHSRTVYSSLSDGIPIDTAREAIARIVGRDTKDMNRTDICRACVETVAENMVDGITAPLFWALFLSLFSAVFSIQPIVLAAIGITAYKTVNTMDSMFGYKNDRYINFGWAAARIDDVVNFIPARLSGGVIILAAFLLREDGLNSFKIFSRDRLNHASPNAAHTEAAVAGALGLKLGGPSSYFGKIKEKPTIGDQLQTISPAHILKTNRLVITASVLFIIIAFIFRGFIFLII